MTMRRMSRKMILQISTSASIFRRIVAGTILANVDSISRGHAAAQSSLQEDDSEEDVEVV
jgi:hypothetical protein